jgi:Fungal specific transcription factor domain
VKTRKSCQFPNLVIAQSPQSLSASYHPVIPASTSLLSAISTPDGTSIAPELSYSSQIEIVVWDDLELLHHFLTVTYKTMASRNDLQQMWQIQVPKLALKQKYLMHSLFSVTALHIASSHPENRSSYIDRAIRHHNIALREYSRKLDSMTRENSASLFACAASIVISTLNLAVSRPHEEPMGPIEEILGIFTLLRGVPLVLGETWDWVRESEISPMFAGRELDDTVVLSDGVTNALKLLEERNQLSSNAGLERHTYDFAIQRIKECFKLSSSNDRDNGMVLSWPISVSEMYITLLRSREQMALVILAYYAVILYEIRDTWWAVGWGSKLVQEVHLLVDSEWRSLIAWPMDQIRSYIR